jgi:hypothetical protein
MTERELTVTAEEAMKLIRLMKGGRFSGAARRMLMDFADEKGWTEEERKQVIAQLSELGTAESEQDEATSE